MKFCFGFISGALAVIVTAVVAVVSFIGGAAVFHEIAKPQKRENEK